VAFTVNGESQSIRIEPRVSLLDALRERLNLFGTKKGCNQGACGACTVLVNGQRMLSCLSLAVQHDGAVITTVEGLATDGQLHPLQTAFADQDGFQCGYCTPGHLCSALGMLVEFKAGHRSAVSNGHVSLADEEIKERMSGNLCRCGAHVGICAAIRQAYEKELAQ
jgi:xanthine dehydrogenase YagT iron-sulfur-binding subunit